MKTDSYTKAVLTVIAAALTVLAFRDVEFFPPANAGKSGPLHETALAKRGETGFAAVPVNPDGSINVKFTETMKVNIAEVGGSYIYGTLPINLKEFSGSSISSYGLPVNIEAVNSSSIYDALPVKIKN